MQRAFVDDIAMPGRRVWRHGHAAAIGSGIAAASIALAALVPNVAAVIAMAWGRAPFRYIALQSACVLFVAALVRYCWRDMRGKKGGLIAIDGDVLVLDLPRDRSLVGHAQAVKTSLPLSEIAAVETRLESFRSLLMGTVQRAYRLKLRTRPPIFLFEERALGSTLADGSMRAVAAEIADRAGVPLDDLGMVEGHAGILNAWFTRVPSWSTPSLSPDEQRARWRRVAWTGILTAAAFLLVVVLRFR